VSSKGHITVSLYAIFQITYYYNVCTCTVCLMRHQERSQKQTWKVMMHLIVCHYSFMLYSRPSRTCILEGGWSRKSPKYDHEANMYNRELFFFLVSCLPNQVCNPMSNDAIRYDVQLSPSTCCKSTFIVQSNNTVLDLPLSFSPSILTSFCILRRSSL